MNEDQISGSGENKKEILLSDSKEEINSKNNLDSSKQGDEEKKENTANPLPNLSTLPTERYSINDTFEKDIKLVGPSTVNGFYKNSTYSYSLSVPSVWPLKVRGEDNISLGITPPKDGQGAIKIEVGENVRAEIEEAKSEAKKYVGMVSLSEKPYTLGGVEGIQLILTNQMVGVKSYYIVISKYNLDYIIKYSNESPLFIVQVEASLKTFKFTK